MSAARNSEASAVQSEFPVEKTHKNQEHGHRESILHAQMRDTNFETTCMENFSTLDFLKSNDKTQQFFNIKDGNYLSTQQLVPSLYKTTDHDQYT